MAKKLCFVIMPFAEKFTPHYRKVYVPAINAAGLREQRADSDAGPEPFVDSVHRGIAGADVVLAELTTKRLNVSYEVGYAHGKGKPVILVAQSHRAVPSDLGHIRLVLYSERKPRWRSKLKAEITEAINAVLDNPRRYRQRRSSGAARKSKLARARVPSGGKARHERPRAGGAPVTPALTFRPAMALWGEQAGRSTSAPQRLGTRGMLRIQRAVPSQVKDLARLLKEHFAVTLQWLGHGEGYALWWDATGAPDVSRVAEFAESLGMVVSAEGYSA